MKLYIDRNTGEVSRELGGAPLSSLVMYLRDILALELVYIDAGVPVTSTVLADNAVQKVGLKAQSSGDLLALASNYTLTSEIAETSLSLNTTELVAYFSKFVPAGAREYPFFFEVEVSSADETERTTYCQLLITIRRDVNQPDDTAPSAVDSDLYVLKGALFDGNGKPISPHFLGMRPDITSAALHRATITLGRSKPWVIATLENSTWCGWTLRTRTEGEADDTDTLRVPDDYHAVNNNSIWVRTSIT